MRNIIRTLHLLVALVAAAFVDLLDVTGSIIAFEPELDHLLHRNLWQVDRQGDAQGNIGTLFRPTDGLYRGRDR